VYFITGLFFFMWFVSMFVSGMGVAEKIHKKFIDRHDKDDYDDIKKEFKIKYVDTYPYSELNDQFPEK